MAGMPPHGEPVTPDDGRSADEPAQWSRRGDLVTFTPMAFDGLAWSRVTGPQQDARAACLLVTAHVHLFNPELALRDLDARAESAIRALEEGAPAVLVIDDRHRVDRSGLGEGTSGMA